MTDLTLLMRKMKLKEIQLAFNSNSYLLEKMKFSMGISKASFKAKKFKSQLQNARHVELLRKYYCHLYFIVSTRNGQTNLAWGEMLRTRALLQSEKASLSFLMLLAHWWNKKWCKSIKWIRKDSPKSIKSTISCSFFKVFLSRETEFRPWNVDEIV